MSGVRVRVGEHVCVCMCVHVCVARACVRACVCFGGARACAMHLTNPPADDERCCGVTSREKRPSRTCTGKAQKPTHA